MEGARAVVVGGGITGAFAAWFLAAAGAEVSVVERDGLAAHASGANPGGLNPLHGPRIPGALSPLAQASFDLHGVAWRQVHDLTGSEAGPSGVARLHAAADPAEVERLRADAGRYERVDGFTAALLDAEELRRREPRLGPAVVGGLWVEGNLRVDAAAYTAAVAAAAGRRGTRVVAGEATGLRRESGRVTGVRLGHATLACDVVVLATGARLRESARWVGLDIPVEAVRGELLLVGAPGGGLAADVSRGSAGIYATGDRRLWLGGTEARGGTVTPTPEARASILAGVGALVPAVADSPVLAHVAAARPSTPDDLPVVGLAPEAPNVCLVGGGGRKGMLLAPALGLAAAELLRDGRTTLPVAGCELDRFALAA